MIVSFPDGCVQKLNHDFENPRFQAYPYGWPDKLTGFQSKLVQFEVYGILNFLYYILCYQ